MKEKPTIEDLLEKTQETITADDVLLLIRRRGRSADEIAQRFKISVTYAEMLCEELMSRGVNLVQKFGEIYSISKTPAPASSPVTIFESDSKGQYLFGALGDSHLCSKYHRKDALDSLYDMYEEAGVKKVFHCGNWVEGESHFNRFDLTVHGMSSQLRYFVDNYPSKKGMTTYFVAGDDHEGWWMQRDGVDVGKILQAEAEAAGRFDLKYIGYMESYITLRHKKSGAESFMLVSHPGGGSAYALSYAAQKIVEAFQGGEKPAVLLLGHFHKMSFDHIRNVWVVQVGCQKDLDPFGRKKRLSYHVGGTLIRLWQNEQGAILDCQPRFRQFFDRGYSNMQWDKQ